MDIADDPETVIEGGYFTVSGGSWGSEAQQA
jgi:hypothetical protein